jgi:uncharacterized membrane protein
MQKFPTLLLRRYFIAGLFVWIPIWVTLLVIGFIVSIIDSSFSLLPTKYQPENWFGVHIPGLGLVFSLVVVFFTGMLVTNYLGRRLVRMGESIVNRIPFVSPIYSATKQVLETLFSSSGESFRKVFLIEYPRKGIWSVAFQTGNGAAEINTKTGHEMITLFIPTTPNPTSGFLMMVPRAEAIELDISVDQALKFVISLGVVQPLSTILPSSATK